jgi:hypothetical protein
VHVIYAATRYQANVEHVLYVYINNRRVTFVRIVTIMNELFLRIVTIMNELCLLLHVNLNPE